MLVLVLVLVLGLGLGGCGADSRSVPPTQGSPGRAAQGPSPAHRLAYRWLIPTTGAPPSVATENQAVGSQGWRLPGPAADVGGLAHGDVSGYPAEPAIAPGQTQKIYVSAPGARWARIRIFRIGWYGGAGGRQVLVSDRLRDVVQPPCTHRAATGLTECDWRPTLSFAIPSAMPSGVYVARLSAPTGESDCLFVVRSRRPEPLLAQLPTSTYEAYNAWGGDSLYPGGADRVGVTATTQGIEVSYDRPYDSVTGAGQFFARDVAMVWFLERYGYPVSYTTSESVDEDPSQLSGHRALIDLGHSEYWSARQEEGFAHALSQGTSLLFFSSDTLAWRVRYAPASTAAGQAGQAGHSIVAYKERPALDPDRATPTGAFPGGGAALTGSAYLGCITPRVDQPGAPTYRYYSWSPAADLQPAWLFAGSGVTPATTIPGIVGYELDQRTSSTPPGTQFVGGGSTPCMSPPSGEPVPGVGQNRADTTLYRDGSGAIVFSTGTLGWELALEPVPSASPDAPAAPDPRVVAMTRNLLAHVLASG
ncbi:MAG: N,N-dimethylformamidase beta subunit family domain-containing protein [Solirubrobacteraceae bacterium]